MAKVKPIPDGYHSIQPYMMFEKCAEAIEFYAKAFGAKERFRMPSPGGGIMHAEIEIGDSIIMMADESEPSQAFAPSHFGGSPVSMLIYTEDCDGIYHRALAAGAVTDREPKDQSYGDRNAAVRDPFGYRWYISTHIKDVSF